MNPLPSRGFTWNIKSYFLWKTVKKYLWMSSAAVMTGTLRVMKSSSTASAVFSYSGWCRHTNPKTFRSKYTGSCYNKFMHWDISYSSIFFIFEFEQAWEVLLACVSSKMFSFAADSAAAKWSSMIRVYKVYWNLPVSILGIFLAVLSYINIPGFLYERYFKRKSKLLNY